LFPDVSHFSLCLCVSVVEAPEKRTDVGEKHGTVELINFTSREPSALPKAVTVG